jgi:hypothetical protein
VSLIDGIRYVKVELFYMIVTDDDVDDDGDDDDDLVCFVLSKRSL